MSNELRRTKTSQYLALIAGFASVNIVFDSLMGLPALSSGVWYSWIFIVEPLNGIVLGPYAGFFSSLIGVFMGHFIYFRDIYEFLFTLGAPIGAMISGFLFRKKWKPVLIYYTVLLTIFFVTPGALQLPIWGMWDVYLAYVILLSLTLITTSNKMWMNVSGRLPYIIAISALTGLEADVLFRIFVFIPGQTYRLFYGVEQIQALRAIWVAGAIVTPIKVAISVLVTTIVGPPIIRVIRKTNLHLHLDMLKKG